MEEQLLQVTRPRRPGARGLSVEQKNGIINHYNHGDTQKEIALQFGCSVSTIKRIIRERRDSANE